MSHRPGSNDLHNMRAIGPMLRHSLIESVLGADYATPSQRRKPAPPQAYHGPTRSRGAPPVREPDAVILEVRRLAEQLGMPPGQIRTHLLAHGVSITINRISQIRNYSTRAHLVPAPGATTYLTKT